jgi:hypothetical protein
MFQRELGHGLKRDAAIVVALSLGLSACAGREPAPVAVVQAQDRYANCAAVIAEVVANKQRIAELGSEKGEKVAQNVAAGVVGLFIWPVWFAWTFRARPEPNLPRCRVGSST